jgi:hypothetical protein
MTSQRSLSAKPLKGSGPSRHCGNARGMPELHSVVITGKYKQQQQQQQQQQQL